MLNPGFPLLLAALLGLILKARKIRYFLTAGALIISLILMFALPQDKILTTASFFDLELILNYISLTSRNIGLIFGLFALLVLVYGYSLLSLASLNLLNIFVGSSIAILFVGDYISFFFFWELISVAAFFLIYDKVEEKLRYTAEYYIIIHVLGGLSLLFGILLNYNFTGEIILAPPEAGLLFFIFGIAIKLGFLGFHVWIPKTYAAIPFQLAVLMAAYTSKVGVYALYRIVELETNIVAYFGLLNALGGILLAIFHSHLRIIISYSIISQIGYMIVGIGLSSQIAVTGGLFHLINHILYKGLLFMMAGTICYSTGFENLSDLGNLWKKTPLTFLAGIIATLSIAGFPFFNGYLSKALIKAGIDSQLLYYGLQLAGVGTSLLFIKVLYFAFLSKNNDPDIVKIPPLSMKLGMVLISAFMMLTAWNPAAVERLFQISPDVAYFSSSSILSGVLPFITALLLFPLLKKYISPHPEKVFQRDFFSKLGYSFINLDKKISQIHSGDLIRYLSWSLLALLVLLLIFLLAG